MTDLADRVAWPWLWFLADWSLRWGVVLVALAAGSALRPGRQAATRHALALSALVAGVLLPVTPRWGLIPWPGPPRPVAAQAQRIVAPPVAVAPAWAEPPGVADAGPVPAADERPPAPRVAERRSIAASSLAALGLVGVWGAVVLALLARWIGGQWVLAGLRRRASAVDAASLGLMEDCRRAVGLTRRVGLATEPSVATPAVLGGRTPLILVPADWADWPGPARRACLLHELSHLARRDDWAKLAQELIRIPVFFHPLVAWLMARLDRERELLCDEAAVALGAVPVDYARLLLDLARRPGRLRPVPRPLRPGWLPFLDRGTVAARIERLLEADMSQTIVPQRARRIVPLGLAALAAMLLVGGLRLRTVAAGPPPGPQSPAPGASPTAGSPAPTGRVLRGTVVGPEGRPVADAIIAARIRWQESEDRQSSKSDAEGKFAWPVPDGEVFTEFVAHKEGLATALWVDRMKAGEEGQVTLRLAKVEPFRATLLDDAGRPMAGAKVRVEIIATASTSGNTTSVGYHHVRPEILGEAPIGKIFEATTDDRGTFAFGNLAPGAWLRLGATGGDGRAYRVEPRGPSSERSLDQRGFVNAPMGGPTAVVGIPAARLSGRVATDLPGVAVAGLKVCYQGSRTRTDRPDEPANFGGETTTDAAGRFAFEGLNDGTVNVCVLSGPDGPWTSRAAQDVALRSGQTAEVAIELVRGVEVEGKVVDRGSGRAVPGTMVGVYGPYRPRSGAMTQHATTDAEGRYRFRLPAGETYFYVMGPATGYKTTEGQSGRTFAVPEGASRYEAAPLELDAAVAVRGRVIDAGGAPIAGATVVGTCEGGRCVPFGGSERITDAQGEFALPPVRDNLVARGQVARLLIRLADQSEHEATTLPATDGAVTVKLAVLARLAPAAQVPAPVAADELAGTVVDKDGRPIEGVEADAWHWAPGHVTVTDRDGRFRLSQLPDRTGVPVRFRRDGYATQFQLDREVGKPGWVVVLDNSSYLEGRVLAPDGSPVAGAAIQADSGPRMAKGFRLSECITEATSGPDGRYRLYAEPAAYDITVRVPGTGVARLKQVVEADRAKSVDIRLEPGVAFEARAVDAQTGAPVAGLRLWHWQKPGIDGTSDAEGRIRLADVPPGQYPRFQVEGEALGYRRWWSDDSASEWARPPKAASPGFQRNFDGLDFDIKPGMGAVTIKLERGARVRGRVLDPDGKPVAGATVAPAKTGSGNSLTGDTRFTAETDAQGRFEALLPASGAVAYNLVAHDGKFREWRTWANGVSPPFKTTPGQTVEGMDLSLSRPCTAIGRVVDAQGRPVAGREVRAEPTSKDENRYFDPTTTTGPDGTFTLRFIRPGEHLVQVAPFWLSAEQAPPGTSRTVQLAPDREVRDLELKAAPDR